MKSANQPPTVVVLGGINMDLIGVAQRLPAPGETLEGERFYTAPGGKGGNQAVAAARLGADVKMVGRVGGDVFGAPLLQGLRGSGVDVSAVAVDPISASGVAVILLDGRRQNHIVAVYGANKNCDDEQVEAAERALDGADTLMLQMEVPIHVSLEAARAARRAGARVIWDPAPVADLPPEAYAELDVLTPNQTEAEALTGVTVTDVSSARQAAEALVSIGAPLAVVKLGEGGAYFASGTASGHAPAYQVEVVDSIAAGDAFGGALAIALSEGEEIEEAVRFGCAAGALAVTKAGAQEAMPIREEVDALRGRSA